MTALLTALMLLGEPIAAHRQCTKAEEGKPCKDWPASRCTSYINNTYICMSYCEKDSDCKDEPGRPVCRKGPVGNKRCAPPGWKDES